MNSVNNKTVVIGASPNPTRYSYLVTTNLHKKGIEVYPIGLRKGKIHGLEIITEMPLIKNVHTVSLYVGPRHQEFWIDYILSLKPQRIIFNPGTENAVFEKKATDNGIEALRACNLVMLSTDQY